jgi:hypothetical protein
VVIGWSGHREAITEQVILLAIEDGHERV